MLRLEIRSGDGAERVREVRALELLAPFGGLAREEPVAGARESAGGSVWRIPCRPGWVRVLATLGDGAGGLGRRFLECCAPEAHRGRPLAWPLLQGGPSTIEVFRHGLDREAAAGVQVLISDFDPLLAQGPTVNTTGATEARTFRPDFPEFYWYFRGVTDREGRIVTDDLPFGALLVTLQDAAGNRRTEVIAHEPGAAPHSLWLETMMDSPAQVQVEGPFGRQTCALWHFGAGAGEVWPLRPENGEIFRSGPPDSDGGIVLAGADRRPLRGVVISPGCEPAPFQLPAAGEATDARRATAALRRTDVVALPAGTTPCLVVDPSAAAEAGVDRDGSCWIRCSPRFSPTLWLAAGDSAWTPSVPGTPARDVRIRLPLDAIEMLASTSYRLASGTSDGHGAATRLRHPPAQVSWRVEDDHCELRLARLAPGTAIDLVPWPPLPAALPSRGWVVPDAPDGEILVDGVFAPPTPVAAVLRTADGAPIVGGRLESGFRTAGTSAPDGGIRAQLFLPCEATLAHPRVSRHSAWLRDEAQLKGAFGALRRLSRRVLLVPAGRPCGDRAEGAMVVIARETGGSGETASPWDGCQTEWVLVPGGREAGIEIRVYRPGESPDDALSIGRIEFGDRDEATLSIDPRKMERAE